MAEGTAAQSPLAAEWDKPPAHTSRAPRTLSRPERTRRPPPSSESDSDPDVLRKASAPPEDEEDEPSLSL